MLTCYLLAINVLSFALMGIDKAKARRNAWRIPEKVLFLAAILGGSVGTLVGMALFRHKTKHWYFVFGMPFIMIINFVIIGFLYYHFLL